MGDNPSPPPTETLVQLVLRAHRSDALIQTDQDWRALGLAAARMLFWYGGAIYACRCEGNEMRFALQVLHASLGSIAHQIAGAYATRLRQTRGIGGAIFRHFVAIPLGDDIFLDDLVLWLHRSERPVISPTVTDSPRVIPAQTRIWTADGAYLKPNSLPWIDTDRVMSALSVGAPGPATYRRRKSEPISPQAIEFFMRRPQRARRKHPLSDAARATDNTRGARPNIETIARVVADYCKIAYDDMLTDTRKRAVSKARVITTVLATRNGAAAAAAARLFNRSRSTLIEQVEHYRTIQPEIFAEAESVLEAFLAAVRE
jgi:Bacterial dnaA protein helix-turn-helix